MYVDADCRAPLTWLETHRAAVRARPDAAGAVGQLPVLRLGLVGPHAAARLRFHAGPGHARAGEVHPADRRGVLRRQLRGAARRRSSAIGGFDTTIEFHGEDTNLGRRLSRDRQRRAALRLLPLHVGAPLQRDGQGRGVPTLRAQLRVGTRCITAQRTRSISTSATRLSASPSFCAIDNRKPQIRYGVRSFCLTDPPERFGGLRRRNRVKLDSHVHTTHSGRATVFPFNHFMRESYNTPESVYATAKRRGMDLVTITDHDQISGALALWTHRADDVHHRLRSHGRIPGRRPVRSPERARHHAGATRRHRAAASRRAGADAVSASAATSTRRSITSPRASTVR